MHAQELGFCDTQFQEQKNKDCNSTLILSNDPKTLVIEVLRPGKSQAEIVRDSPQSTFPTSPLTVWYRESVRFAVRLP